MKLSDAKVFHGASQVDKIYHGANLAWQKASSGAWHTIFEPSTSIAYSGGMGHFSPRNIILSSWLSHSGSKVRVFFKSSDMQGLRLCNVGIMQRDGQTQDGVDTPVQLFFPDNNAEDLIPVGEEHSAEANFNLDNTKDHLISFYVSGVSADDYNNDEPLTHEGQYGLDGYYAGWGQDSLNKICNDRTNPYPLLLGISKIEAWY